MLLAFVSCNSGHNNEAHGHHSVEEEAAQHEGHAHPDHGEAGDEIILSPEAAEKFGVKVSTLELQPFSEAIKVSGVIEGAPGDVASVVAKSSGVVNLNSGMLPGKKIGAGTVLGSVSSRGFAGGDADEVASLQYEAAKKEYERMTPLYKDGIVSAKDYNAAQTAYEQAKAAYSGRSAGSSLVSPASGVITELLVKQGDFVNAGQPVATVSGNTRLMLRADLPQKYHSRFSGITTANFRPSYSEEVISLESVNGRRATASDNVIATQPGYLPVYFSFDNDGSIVAGSDAEVYLMSAPRDSVLIIPVSALTEQQGKLFAYVRVDDHGYEKRNVTIGVSDGKKAELLSGLHEGETVVTDGVIFVKLAETANVVPEGHSHNH